jgi:hypothetical protein
VTSIRAHHKSANTAISKDIGIYVHTLHPTPSVKATFKKSSTQPNGLAVTPTHIFAAQVDKSVVHVYSRERGNQEALIAFPERIHSVVLIQDGLLALGSAEGRIFLWEVGQWSSFFHTGHMLIKLPDFYRETSLDSPIPSSTCHLHGSHFKASDHRFRRLTGTRLVYTKAHVNVVDRQP